MQGLLKEMFFFYSCQNLIGRVGGDCPLASGSDGPDCRFYIRYANYLAVKCTAAADYNGLIVVAGKATLFSILLFLCNSFLQAPAKVFFNKILRWALFYDSESEIWADMAV